VPSRDLLLARLAAWAADGAGGPDGPRLPPELVHKHRPENVALSRIDAWDPEQPRDRCVAQVLVDPEHPYFFEHPVDHVPGLLLIEAARQLCIAAAHRFLEVPLHAAMIVDEVHVRFERYAELDPPLFIALQASQPQHRGDRFTGARLDAEFLQDERTLGHIRIDARLMWWVR
jgi:hypothetical protein